jgi:predicted permease
VGLVLLIACANAANLLLVRGEVRQRELALRAALGAGRRRVVRQLLTESALLALAAGAIGLGLAAWGARALLAVHPDALPRHDHVSLDLRVAGVALALSLLTGLLFGVLPALQASRANVQGLLRSAGRGGTARERGTLRRALVVGEVALAVVVVVAAGLLLRSFQALRHVDAGLDPRGVLTMATSLPSTVYPPDRVAPAYAELLDRIRALPGVEAAGAVRLLPLAVTGWNWNIVVEGRPTTPGAPVPSPRPQVVTPGALEAMRVTFARGRGITAGDDADAPLVALVNETMARTLWPGGNAIGKRFGLSSDSVVWTTVVGVVRDVRSGGLRETPAAEFYLPHAQFPRFGRGSMRTLTIVARTGGDPALLAAPVRRALHAMDPDLAAADVRTMRQVVDRSVAQPRLTMLLLLAFGGAALLLAAVGVYGVISYAVAQRKRELGIRLALGARGADVVRLVVGQGLRLAAVGVAVGVAAALVASRVLGALLFGVRATDPGTFLAIPLLLLAVALLASAVPALRALRTDPTTALRAE